MDSDKLREERQKLEEAIAAQESLRGTLDDTIINATIDTLREKLQNLERQVGVQRQRKLVSLLFVDMVGSTRSTQDMDPEEVMEIMDDAMKQLAQPVKGFGGRVIKFKGDGFIAVFGFSRAQENDPERAIRAGLGILKESEQNSTAFCERWGLEDFQVRIGVNTGLVAFGGETEGEDSMAGGAVNLAARLETSAPPGGLLISHDTYRHVRGVFNVKPQDPILVKGFDEPIQTYLVMQAKPRAFRTPTRGVEGIETRMVGREKELSQLQDALNNILEGRAGHTFTINGDAGIGKSRLLYEFDQWIELLPEQIWFYKGRCLQERQSIPSGVVRDLFAYRFQIQEDDSKDAIWHKFESGFSDIYGEAEATEMHAHIVGQYLGYDFSQSDHLKGALSEPQQVRERGMNYIDDYFEMVAKQDPTVIFLEDIHWADDSSLDLIDLLVRKVPMRRMLVVCLTRPSLFERKQSWSAGQDFHTRLNLEPLSKIEGRMLVQEIMRYVDQIPDTLRELILNNADGNPYYIEELIKKLIEDGVIVKGEERWYLKPGRIEISTMPETLTGLLQSRLDALPVLERDALQMASVIGRIFWLEPIIFMRKTHDGNNDALLNGEGIPALLESLRNREMIFRREISSISEASEFVFKHAVLREVTYESTPKRDRKNYHRLVAAWLKGNLHENVDNYAGIIADHFAHSGATEQAGKWYIKAANLAKSRGGYIEAHDYLVKNQAFISPDNRERMWEYLLLFSEVVGVLGNIDERTAVDEELIKLASEHNDRKKLGEADFRRAHSYSVVGDYQQALDHYSHALQLAEHDKNISAKGKILSLQAMLLSKLGDQNSADTAANRAMKCAEMLADGEERAMILTNVSNYYSNIGNLYESTLLIEEVLAATKRIGNKYGESINLGNLGYNYLLIGKFTEGRVYIEKSITLSNHIGAQSVYHRLNLIIALLRLKLYDEALQSKIVLYEDLRWSKDQFAQGIIQTYSGLIHEMMGDIKAALGDFSQSEKKLLKIQISSYARDAQAGKVRCLLAQKELEDASGEAQILLNNLLQWGTAGMEFPYLAYLTCVDTFHKVGDREKEIEALRFGYEDMMHRAGNLGSDDWRESFLGNIPENAVLIARWKKVFSAT